MTQKEREELIALLSLITGYRESAFEKMSDEELEREYDKTKNR